MGSFFSFSVMPANDTQFCCHAMAPLCHTGDFCFNACIMFSPQEQTLIHAANTLRHAVEHFQCSHFESLLSINNLYFLHLCDHIQNVSFARLEQSPSALQKPVTPSDLKINLIETCYEYSRDERRAAPFAYETKHSAFFE